MFQGMATPICNPRVKGSIPLVSTGCCIKRNTIIIVGVA